jgi:DNA-binding winged helix-turn-helix (wHTH) protein
VSISPAETGVWRFGAFVLDTQRYELRSGDDVIRVEPQVFDVITQLVRNSHRFVTKEELSTQCGAGASSARRH